MSGPVEERDLSDEQPTLALEAREGRRTTVGGMPVVRVLPTKGRRTVGAWCFVDVMGPADADEPDPMEVGPHPHMGLSTVTWLLEGEALHTDSLGTEQVIRPGETNWMTAGHGIAHSELAARPPFRGVQMWVAQPERTRHRQPSFEHIGDLPRADIDGADVTVFAGTLAGSPATVETDTPLVGAEVTVGQGQIVIPVTAAFEHAVIPLDAPLLIGDHVVEPGWLAHIPAGIEELVATTRSPGGRALLLGGEPFPERIQMWWNFVGRDRGEFEVAWRDWQERTDRFGAVPSSLDRIDAPRPPWLPAS